MEKHLLKKYIAIVTCLISSFLVISLSAIAVHNFTLAGNQPGSLATENDISSNGDNHHQPNQPQPTPRPPQGQGLPDLNILVLGLDDGNLPDAIFVIMFDGENNAIDVLSIPRDIQVVLTPTEREMLRATGRWFPDHGVFKLNEMHAYAGMANGYRLVSYHLENMLGIEIHNYVLLNMDAFKYVIDEVGGIYMYFPQPLRYLEPGATIHVNIPAGLQHLDGTRAEQVVRFRRFADGDLGRIRLQQEFMREFFTQVLGRENIMGNLGVLISSFLSHVRTDFGILDALPYIRVADALNPESIEFHMVPGVARFEANPAGTIYSFFFPDIPALGDLMKQIRADNALE